MIVEQLNGNPVPIGIPKTQSWAAALSHTHAATFAQELPAVRHRNARLEQAPDALRGLGRLVQPEN